jgi:hypothetical protein
LDKDANSLITDMQQARDPTAFALLVFAMGHPSTKAFDLSNAQHPIKVIMAKMARIRRLVLGNPAAAAALLDLVVHVPEVAAHVPWDCCEELLAAPRASSQQAIQWLQQLPEDWRAEVEVHSSRRFYLVQGIKAALSASASDEQQQGSGRRQADQHASSSSASSAAEQQQQQQQRWW